MKSIDQDRAKHAWAVVKDVAGKKPERDDAQDFRRAVQDMPARMIASGFVQTVVFLKAKAEKQPGSKGVLLRALAHWLTHRKPIWPAGAEAPAVTVDDWIGSLVPLDLLPLRLLTAEAMAYVGWLKRFAEAEIPKPKKKHGASPASDKVPATIAI
jgi:CRISPR-associated protein Cmr5